MNFDIFFVMVAWENVTQLFGNFTNGSSILSNPLVLGLIILLFFAMLILALRFTFVLLVVPMFLVIFIASEMGLGVDIRVIVGIMLGVLVGLSILKWIRK